MEISNGDRERINIEAPRWNQETYFGRAMHFFTTTDPRNLLCSSKELDNAKDIVTRYRAGEALAHLSYDEIWRAKHIYDSAFHPETGEKMIIIGRMSAQVPMNMMITAAMLTFYKTTRQVVFWQWFNQSFNAVVNYTNRSGSSPISVDQLGVSYLSATSAALITALGLNRLVKRAPPLIGRFVPFVAVAAANCINIPLMRQKEIKEGIEVYDESGQKLGNSKIAAKKAIREVVFSRIAMASPGMILPPILMNNLERRGILTKFPFISLPLQTALCGTLLVFATPMCCAIFPQKSSLPIISVETEIQARYNMWWVALPPLLLTGGLISTISFTAPAYRYLIHGRPTMRVYVETTNIDDQVKQGYQHDWNMLGNEHETRGLDYIED